MLRIIASVLTCVLVSACGSQSPTTGPTPPASPSPAPAPTPPLTLSQIDVETANVVGGGTVNGTVTLSAPAPSEGVQVTLSSSDATATLPASVTIAAGAASAPFTITTRSVDRDTRATIAASALGGTRTVQLSVNTLGVIDIFTTTTSYVSEGVVGELRLAHRVPGHTYVTISSSRPALIPEDAVLIPADGIVAGWRVSAHPPADDTPVTLTAAAGGRTISRVLIAMPPHAITVDSQPGDPVGRGQSFRFSSSGIAMFDATVCKDNGALVDARSTFQGTWQLSFFAPQGQRLTTGTYEAGESSSGPLISVVPAGGGCPGARPIGKFTIFKIDYNDQGRLLRLEAGFEQRCPGASAGLTGAINAGSHSLPSRASSQVCR